MSPRPRSEWSERTRVDIDAIDRWMRAAYPAFVDPHNARFATQWEAALGDAQRRVSSVATAEGWRACVSALVNAAGDGHVRLSFSELPDSLGWSGYAVELKEDRYWLVRVGDAGDHALDGAELVSCGDLPAAALAEERLDGFRGIWSAPANRRRMVAELLVDTRNPFIPKLGACVLARDGHRSTWVPTWEDMPAAEVQKLLSTHRGIWFENANNLKLRFQPDGAAWISVGNLIDGASVERLRLELLENRQRVVKAPYLVWDVRGNPGGNSALGVQLAEAVWGDDTVPDGPTGPREHDKQWRVSAALAADLKQSVVAADENGQATRAGRLRSLLGSVEQGLADGVALVPDPRILDDGIVASSPRAPATRASSGPAFVLTDGGCFSSCIMFVNALRRMDAVQVGFPTGVDTMYGEALFSRELPSHRASLLLPVAIFNDVPDQLGGLPPDLPWKGPAKDHDGISAFIAQAAAPVR